MCSVFSKAQGCLNYDSIGLFFATEIRSVLYAVPVVYGYVEAAGLLISIKQDMFPVSTEEYISKRV